MGSRRLRCGGTAHHTRRRFHSNLGRFQLYASEMSLKLASLHEGDLFNLLDGINEKANGIFSVNFCKFSNSGSIVLDNPEASNIIVDCNIDWYTIKLADGSEIQV